MRSQMWRLWTTSKGTGKFSCWEEKEYVLPQGGCFGESTVARLPTLVAMTGTPANMRGSYSRWLLWLTYKICKCSCSRWLRHLQDNGQWINNVTYCGGRHDKCDTNIIVTIANVSMPVPGVRYTLRSCDNHHEHWLLVHLSIFKDLFLLHLMQVMQLHLQHYKESCNNHWKKFTTIIVHFCGAKTIDAGCPPRLRGRASCSSIRGLATRFLSTSRLRLHDVVSIMLSTM